MTQTQTQKFTFAIDGPAVLQPEYSDRWSCSVEIPIRRSDGATGTVWMTVGVPDYQQGSAQAAFRATGAADCPDSWISVHAFEGGCLEAWIARELYAGIDDDSEYDYHEMKSDLERLCAPVCLEVAEYSDTDRNDE